MMIQLSKFTAHGSTQPLEKIPDADRFVTRYEIPAEAKVTLRKQLFLLGVRREVLFPDLDNLAKAIMEEFEARSDELEPEKPEESAEPSAH